MIGATRATVRTAEEEDDAHMRRDHGRFPRSVFEDGEDPDPRFSLANERTFLAWIRTGLAFVAAGLAVEALQLPVAAWLRVTISVLLVLAGIAATAQAWLSWVRTERAMRHLAPLPSSGLKLPIAVLLGLVALAVVAGLLL
jgi:putative membrane protein